MARHRAPTPIDDDPAALLGLAERYLIERDVPAALAAARRAVSLDPRAVETRHMLCMAELAAEAEGGNPARLAEAWRNIGVSCHWMGDLPQAVAALERALAAKPDDAVTAAELAVLLGLRGEPVECERRLRKIVEADPRCLTARLYLATHLNLAGEPEAALRLLVGKVPPGQMGVHWLAQQITACLAIGRVAVAHSLLRGLRAPLGDAEILILWQLALLARRAGDRRAVTRYANQVSVLAGDRNAARPEHRINALFEVARLYEEDGKADRAFSCWVAAHAMLRVAQPFSRAGHADLVEAIETAYPTRRVRVEETGTKADVAPVFIVGLPRSGTSLTEQILAAHPMVFGAGERLAINETLHRLAGNVFSAVSVRSAAALDLDILTAERARYLAELHRLAPSAARIIDKLPGNVLRLGFIADLLPGARVIHCTRDPRDVGLSIFRNQLFGYHPYAHDLADLGWYIAQHQRLTRHWDRVVPLPILTVDLRDWVEDFDATLRRVLHFLSLPLDAACSNFHNLNRKVLTASRNQVKEPINARGIGVWRRYASHLGPMLAELPSADVSY